MINTLPSLPEPTDYGRGLYTADQMCEYARAALAQPAASGEPGGVAEFAEGQWWLKELDAMVSSGTHDQKRAVAVVRNLLRTSHSAVPKPQPARVPLTDDQILNIIDDVLEGGSLVDVARAIESAHGIK